MPLTKETPMAEFRYDNVTLLVAQAGREYVVTFVKDAEGGRRTWMGFMRLQPPNSVDLEVVAAFALRMATSLPILSRNFPPSSRDWKASHRRLYSLYYRLKGG